MTPAPVRHAPLLRALREAAAAIEAGAPLEQVRGDLEPRLAAGWLERDGAEDVERLLRRNGMLERSLNRLTLDVQVLLEVIERGEVGSGG